jgi:hypothetical protein
MGEQRRLDSLIGSLTTIEGFRSYEIRNIICVGFKRTILVLCKNVTLQSGLWALEFWESGTNTIGLLLGQGISIWACWRVRPFFTIPD